MSNLTYDEAKKVEGQKFKVVMDDSSELELTLHKVTQRGKLRSDFPGRKRDPFTLTFKSAPGHYCEQRSYTLKNATLGEQLVFIVPLGCDDATETYTYEAVFS
jgi:hypothetical protein